MRLVELSPKRWDIANAIEESKYILEIEADFDDEGSQGCQFSTWEKARNFLVKYSQWALKSFNYIIDRPKIYDGPDSSVDILWKTVHAPSKENRAHTNVKGVDNRSILY